MFVNVDSKMIFHVYYACMFMVCNRTVYDVPNFNGLLDITTKPKDEEKNCAVSPCYFTFDKGVSNIGFEKRTSPVVSLYQPVALFVSFRTDKVSNR
jgi:hypothetical protein